MHVTFVSLGMEQLGIEYLSAYLKKEGIETSLVHNPALFNDRFQLHIPFLAKLFNEDELIVQRILELEPDLLAFGALTNTFSWSIDIARKVREHKKIPVIFGGVHASAEPAFVMEFDEVDYVCQSEGEYALAELCARLEKGEEVTGIPNIWTKDAAGNVMPPETIQKFIPDLDALPFPDKDLFAETIPKRYVYRIMTARGCPYRCTFCFNNFFAHLPSEGKQKDYVRRRSVDNVMQELLIGKEKYDYSVVEFHDDIFTMNKDWLSEFLPRFKQEIGVPFICETHAKFMDDDIARMLKENGCAGAKMGIQSLDSDTYKRRTLKRGESEAEVRGALESCRRAGLQLDADHIFGLPGESENALQNAMNFYRENTPGRIACFFLTYFPGIEITNAEHAAGNLSDQQLEDIKKGHMLWYHQVQALTPDGRKNLRMNRAYMVAFTVLPSVPRFLRRFVHPNVFKYLPGAVPMARGLMALRMLIDWLFDGNFGAILYLRLYLHNIVGKGRALNRTPRSRTR